jgi:hypothetical protein
MGYGFDEWIYWHLRAITLNYNHNGSQPIFSRTLFPWLPRIRSILVLVLRLSSRLLWLTSFWCKSRSPLIYGLHIYDCTHCRLSTTGSRFTHGLLSIVSRQFHRKHLRYCCEVFSASCIATNIARTTKHRSFIAGRVSVGRYLPCRC